MNGHCQSIEWINKELLNLSVSIHDLRVFDYFMVSPRDLKRAISPVIAFARIMCTKSRNENASGYNILFLQMELIFEKTFKQSRINNHINI